MGPKILPYGTPLVHCNHPDIQSLTITLCNLLSKYCSTQLHTLEFILFARNFSYKFCAKYCQMLYSGPYTHHQYIPLH